MTYQLILFGMSEDIARKSRAPKFVQLANILTTTLLRVGIKLNGFGNYPMYLLTVRGRKSGRPRTLPIALIEQNGERYVSSPYGIVDWVLNLREAGVATLTRGGHTETVSANELSPSEAAPVLKENFKRGNPFARYFGVTSKSSFEDFERAAVSHPVFLFESK